MYLLFDAILGVCAHLIYVMAGPRRVVTNWGLVRDVEHCVCMYVYIYIYIYIYTYSGAKKYLVSHQLCKFSHLKR